VAFQIARVFRVALDDVFRYPDADQQPPGRHAGFRGP
jgi:hypothetical protein